MAGAVDHNDLILQERSQCADLKTVTGIKRPIKPLNQGKAHRAEIVAVDENLVLRGIRKDNLLTCPPCHITDGNAVPVINRSRDDRHLSIAPGSQGIVGPFAIYNNSIRVDVGIHDLINETPEQIARRGRVTRLEPCRIEIHERASGILGLTELQLTIGRYDRQNFAHPCRAEPSRQQCASGPVSAIRDGDIRDRAIGRIMAELVDDNIPLIRTMAVPVSHRHFLTRMGISDVVLGKNVANSKCITGTYRLFDGDVDVTVKHLIRTLVGVYSVTRVITQPQLVRFTPLMKDIPHTKQVAAAV